MDPKDIHIVDKMIQENMEKEDQDLRALSSIAGKPKKQEKFPAFKSPLIEKMAENYAVQSQSSSSSGFDSDVGDFNNENKSEK